MELIELITSDHDAAAELIRQLEELAGDDRRTSEAMRLAVKLAVTLKTHARAEEKVLYDALRTASPALSAYALTGAYEHQTLDLMLDKLVLHRPGPELAAILKVANELFEHHARIVEEGQVLPALAAVLSADERVQLGRDMASEKLRLQPQIERLVGAPARPDVRGLHIHAHRR